ncbi:MAG: phosphoribosylformylglycinamidine synthase [Chloroflexi bacterium]|nr:MAG: phosphoribosylformylglycinamidine synthase [Chloroflexota bacterium]
MFLAHINVSLKPTVNDPQGIAIQQGLRSLGFQTVEKVRAGKRLEVHLQESDRAKAEAQVDEMCQRLLANTVIERYEFELEEINATA